LEEDPTGTIYDSTSNNNDATSYGTMTSNDQVSGKINGALDFDGSDDYISWTTAISSTSGTYSWWMYTHSVVGERNYIADDAYRRRISLWDDVVKIETDTEAEYFDFTTSSISANTWTHIVFVRSGDVGDLYVDGMLVQQVTVPEADNLTLSGIGGTSDNTRMVDGLMDEVRISNITRSFDWIATEYNNQFVSESFYSTGNTEYGPNYQGLPVVVEWVTGEIENSNSVTTNSTILGMPDHLYIAAVSSKGYRDTTSVTGLGLTWNELEDQPSGRSATGMSVWYAIGTSTITTGTVTANITDLQQVALQVYRIAGVNTSDPIGDHESANTNGENGAGSGGIDNDSPYLDIVTTSPNATVIGMIAKRQRDYIALGTGYTFLTENQAGTSGSAAGILSVYKTVTSAGTVVVNATIETEVDWAVVGVEIKPNSQIIIDEISPTLNYFGLEDPGTGTGTFWANVSDNIAVSSVNLKINSSSYDMTFNGSLWTYQFEASFGGYYTYQITNASDFSNNFLASSSSVENHTFNSDNLAPSVIDFIYDETMGYNGTFRANITDSWGEGIDTVFVTVTSCECISSNIALMQLNGTEYINDTILMKSGTIFFTISVNDTFNNIFTSGLQSGNVANKAPSAGNLTLLPASVTSNDSLTLNYDYFDIDDDVESGTEIRWYNNSILQPLYNDLTTLPASALFKGDQWYATVRPNDGALFGSMVNSSLIDIENTLPQVSNVFITPSNPVNTSALTASYTYSDLDTDTENTGMREISWYKNGVVENTYNNLLLLPNTATTKGETWNYRIRVHDGSDYSNWINSSSVTILNSAPTASAIEILNASPKTDDDLVANWTYDDLDLDAEDPNWKLYWYKNDILQTGLNHTKTVQSGNTTKTDIWYFELQVFDGTNYSILYQSASVQVLNTAPTASDIGITPPLLTVVQQLKEKVGITSFKSMMEKIFLSLTTLQLVGLQLQFLIPHLQDPIWLLLLILRPLMIWWPVGTIMIMMETRKTPAGLFIGIRTVISKVHMIILPQLIPVQPPKEKCGIIHSRSMMEQTTLLYILQPLR
ncbi:MAG: LamG domain-containing protein, partial [Candidatus Kariarchaeaceae archaeon]